MKTLKIVEKVLFILSIVIACASICFGLVLALGYSDTPIVTTLAIFIPMGSGLVVAALCVGGFMKYLPTKALSAIGDGLVIASMSLLLGTTIYGIIRSSAVIAVIVALVACIVYIAYLIVRLVIYIVRVTKPDAAYGQDPDDDPRIAHLLKWKALVAKGIITEEEFQQKRNEILQINKE